MNEPRNVDDVPYAELAGPRPMKEVLRERHQLVHEQDKKTREHAFRIRCGMIGDLASCLCCYPLEKAETSSEHREWCPAHLLHLSREEQSRVDAARSAR